MGTRVGDREVMGEGRDLKRKGGRWVEKQQLV